jgi:hypothetical protein
MKNLDTSIRYKRAKRHDKEWIKDSGGWRSVKRDGKVGREWEVHRQELMPFRQTITESKGSSYGKGNRCLRHFECFLTARRGRLWDEVYAELCAGTPAGTYARAELETLIERINFEVQWVDGAPVFPGGHRYFRWYVDPRDGCLKHPDFKPVEQPTAHKSNYKLKKAALKDMIRRGEIKKRRVMRAPKV